MYDLLRNNLNKIETVMKMSQIETTPVSTIIDDVIDRVVTMKCPEDPIEDLWNIECPKVEDITEDVNNYSIDNSW